MRIGLVVFTAILHNFSAGYNSGVIAGAMTSLKSDFDLDALLQGMLVSCILVGALIGSQAASFFLEKFGRKNSIVLSNFIYIIGVCGMSFSPNLPVLIAFRSFLGFAVGLSNVFTSTYIAEISPPKLRGKLGSAVPFAFTTGTIMSNVMYLAVNGYWRYMFGIGIVPAVLQLSLGFIVLPE